MSELFDFLGNKIEPGKTVIYVEGQCPNLQFVKATVVEVRTSSYTVNPFRMVNKLSIKVWPIEKSRSKFTPQKGRNFVILKRLETVVVLNEE